MTEIVTAEGSSPIDIHSLKSMHVGDVVEAGSVGRWVRRFER